MKHEVEEAIEAIRLHAMWMMGRSYELTSDEKMKEVVLWGGTNRDERGERLLSFINIIDDWIQKEEQEK